MTAAAFQSLGISDNTIERLNRLVIGVATMAADNFRERGGGEAWPAIEKCLLKFSIIVDLLVMTVFPSLSAVGTWEEVLFFSMDFTVSQNLLELVLQDAHFCLKKLASLLLS
jgi:hypothetical protein